MYVPVKDLIYSVWSPTQHKAFLNTPNIEEAILYYESHSLKNELEVWKITTTVDGYNEHTKIR